MYLSATASFCSQSNLPFCQFLKICLCFVLCCEQILDNRLKKKKKDVDQTCIFECFLFNAMMQSIMGLNFIIISFECSGREKELVVLSVFVCPGVIQLSSKLLLLFASQRRMLTGCSCLEVQLQDNLLTNSWHSEITSFN